MSDIYDPICPICGKEKEYIYNKILKVDTYKPHQHETDKETADTIEREKANIKDGRNNLYFEYIKNSGIENGNKQKRFCNFDTENKAELETAKNTCIDFSADPNGNLIIIGGVGIGKTHLAASIINQYCYDIVSKATDEEILTYHKYGRKPRQTPAFYIRECDLRNAFRNSMNFSNSEESTSIIRKCKNRLILCIDDIGVRTDYTENDLSILYDIIDTRYTKELPTIITSNCLPKEIAKTIGDRCYDRLKSNAAIISISGISHRKAKV